MIDVRKVNLEFVNSYGKYIDLNTPLIFDLSDEDILALRKYHNNPDIASERQISVKRHSENNKRVMSRNQKYNNGRYRTKNKIKGRYGKAIIVGGLVVFVVFSLKTLNKPLPKEDMTSISTIVEDDEIEYSNPSMLEIVDMSITSATNPEPEENLKSIYESQLDNAYVIEQEYMDNQENNETADMIRHACDIYQVNYDVVYEKIKELTDDFSSDSYLNGTINGVTCKKAPVVANSEEELIIYTVRCMKQLPSSLGVDTSNLYINNGYNSGTNYYEQLNFVANTLGIDRCLLYAVVNAECSFNSPLFMNSNNPAGLKGTDGNWWVFDTKEEGFFELGMEILKYYRMIGVSPNNIDAGTLSRIRDIHAPLSDGNENWLPNVLDGLEYAKMHEAEMFGNPVQNNGLSL